jgi:hypothetical protein
MYLHMEIQIRWGTKRIRITIKIRIRPVGTGACTSTPRHPNHSTAGPRHKLSQSLPTMVFL